MNEKHEILIKDWFRRVRVNQFAHYACGNYFSKLNFMLGIPTIILSTLVGTAVFVSLDNQAVGNYKIAIGFVSMLASVLAALHTFLGFSQRAEKHRLTATAYSSIRRELELIKTFPIEDSVELSKKLETIKIQIDHLAESAEEVPKRVWEKNRNALKSKEHKRIFHIAKKSDVQSEKNA